MTPIALRRRLSGATALASILGATLAVLPLARANGIELEEPVINTGGSTALAGATEDETNTFHHMVMNWLAPTGSTTPVQVGGLSFDGQYADAGHGVTDAVQAAQLPTAVVYGGGRGQVGLWLRGYGMFNRLDRDNTTPGVRADTGGVAAGIDYRITDQLLVGALFGWGRTDVSYDGTADSGRFDSYHVGVYGGATLGQLYLTGLVTYGFNDYSRTRPVAGFGTAQADYDGNEVGVSAEAGYTLPVAGFNLRPAVGLDYLHLEVDGFTETGAGASNQTVASQDVDSLRSRLGFRADRPIPVSGDVVLVPEVRAFWEHEYLDRDRSISASFAGIPGNTFTINGIAPTRDAALLGAGLTGNVAPNVALFVDYDASLRENQTIHLVSGGVRVTFGGTAPAAVATPAAPAPGPTAAEQIYLVFFDFDRSNLTAEGREVVGQVATRAMQPGAAVQQVQVSGHTDRAGSAQYNVGLSQRRAETVRRALVERGVPANEIVTRWFGETQNRVATPDGVREPQNRRVEIVLM